jgi:hypothetical protein
VPTRNYTLARLSGDRHTLENVPATRRARGGFQRLPLEMIHVRPDRPPALARRAMDRLHVHTHLG